MDLEPVFEYESSFNDEKQAIVETVRRWSSRNRIDSDELKGFESLIAIKNIERTYTFANRRFSDLFTSGRTSVGKNTDRTLEPKFRKLSQGVDALILDGVRWVEMEHYGIIHDGRCCSFITYKRRLDELKDPNYQILLISRPLAFAVVSKDAYKLNVSDLLRKFLQLDKTDQLICRAFAHGDSAKEVAEQVKLTKRAVELRRQRIMETFGFGRPVEIVKMLVRLEEWGML